jgi:hypothetical protein
MPAGPNSMLADALASKTTNTARLTKVFHDLDRNRDGALSLEEFTPLSKAMRIPEEHVQSTFSHIDTDSNCVISESELLAFFRQAHRCNDFDVMSDDEQQILDGVFKKLKVAKVVDFTKEDLDKFPPSTSSPSPQMPTGPPPPPPKVENLAPEIEEEVADVGTVAAADDKVASATEVAEAPGWVQGIKQEMQGCDREAPSGGGSVSPDIDEDPEVLVTEWDVLADNMALMYQDAAEHCLEPVEKLEPVKMAQNAKKKCAAAPSTRAGGSQKTAPVVSSAKTRAKGVIAVRMDANSPVSTQVNNIIISLGK